MAIEVLNKNEINEVAGGLSVGVSEGAIPLLNLDLNMIGALGVVFGAATAVIGIAKGLLHTVLGTLNLG